MILEVYIGFVLACVVLALIPGPNVALIVANSLSYGTRYGLYALAGSSTAMVPQLLAVSLGLSSLLVLMSEYFEFIRWAGITYLVYLAFKYWRMKAEALSFDAADVKKRRLRSVYWNGFWVSAANPKTLLFFGAFMPQFLNAQASILPQMLLLCVTFIFVVTLFDVGWAVFAGFARGYLGRLSQIRYKLSGALFFCSAVGLAAARKY